MLGNVRKKSFLFKFKVNPFTSSLNAKIKIVEVPYNT